MVRISPIFGQSAGRQIAALLLLGFAGTATVPAAAAESNLSPPATGTFAIGTVEAAHLRRGLAYFEHGKYENANLEFEAVLYRKGLPPTPRQQAEVYAEAAQTYLAGRRFDASGYALLGFGNYAENDTRAGSGETNDLFLSARVGTRANYQLSAANTLNVSLEFRFRTYDDGNRRDDAEPRWNANVSHTAGNTNIAVGVRGRASYRGNGQVRNDFGVFTEINWLANPDDQFNFGAELRRRVYPQGPLRERSRDIIEFTGGWTHALFDGRASFNLAAGGGLEVATDDRPDGDSTFVSISPTLSFSINDNWGGYVFLWWQNDAFNIERTNSPDADKLSIGSRRNDDLLELGGGLTWELGRGWSLNPEILWIRDFSNVLSVNYSSTELQLSLRRDF